MYRLVLLTVLAAVSHSTPIVTLAHCCILPPGLPCALALSVRSMPATPSMVGAALTAIGLELVCSVTCPVTHMMIRWLTDLLLYLRMNLGTRLTSFCGATVLSPPSGASEGLTDTHPGASWNRCNRPRHVLKPEGFIRETSWWKVLVQPLLGHLPHVFNQVRGVTTIQGHKRPSCQLAS